MGHACIVEETELFRPVLVDSRQLSLDQLPEEKSVYATPNLNRLLLLDFVGDSGKGTHPNFVSVPAGVHEKARHLKVLREAVEKHSLKPSWLWLSIRIPATGVASLILPIYHGAIVAD